MKRKNVAMGWLVAENDFYLFKLGLMSEEVMEVNEGLFSLYYDQCDVRDIYEARRHLMDVEFVQIVESQSDPCD